MFTWTEEKNQLNKKKHGFYFSEILDVFDDPHLLELYDVEHSTFEEDRYITLGYYHNNVILFVVTANTFYGNNQIITAREATPKEQEIYYEQYKKNTDSSQN